MVVGLAGEHQVRTQEGQEHGGGSGGQRAGVPQGRDPLAGDQGHRRQGPGAPVHGQREAVHAHPDRRRPGHEGPRSSIPDQEQVALRRLLGATRRRRPSDVQKGHGRPVTGEQRVAHYEREGAVHLLRSCTCRKIEPLQRQQQRWQGQGLSLIFGGDARRPHRTIEPSPQRVPGSPAPTVRTRESKCATSTAVRTWGRAKLRATVDLPPPRSSNP